MMDLERAATFRDRLEKAGLQPVPWQGHMAVMAGSLVDIWLVGQALPGMRCPVISVVDSGTQGELEALRVASAHIGGGSSFVMGLPPGYVCYWDQVPYVGSYEERNQE